MKLSNPPPKAVMFLLTMPFLYIYDVTKCKNSHKSSGAGLLKRSDYYIGGTPLYQFRIISGLVEELVEHDIRLLSDEAVRA